MPIKNYEKFEKAFYVDGKFNQKVFEAYWDDDQPMDEYRGREEGRIDNAWDYDKQTDSMILHINYQKLTLMGLLEYQDIVEKSMEWFEKQIAAKSYGTILPPLDDIRDYVIGLVGLDYKDYITEENLDNLTRFIYQEIDNYVFD